ncbi:MAG: hypothetical protein FWD73_00775 [Polyangiaceae bacterium]|nr:hypothetical protein [Polyangiaceae bacterium]
MFTQHDTQSSELGQAESGTVKFVPTLPPELGPASVLVTVLGEEHAAAKTTDATNEEIAVTIKDARIKKTPV